MTWKTIPAGQILLLIYTLLSGWEDYRTREWKAIPGMIFAGMGIVCSICAHRSIGEVLAAMIPGAALMLLSVLSAGRVGMGDGLFLVVCACLADLRRLIWMMTFASLVCAAAGLILIWKGYQQCANTKPMTLPYLTAMLPGLLLSFMVLPPA